MADPVPPRPTPSGTSCHHPYLTPSPLPVLGRDGDRVGVDPLGPTQPPTTTGRGQTRPRITPRPSRGATKATQAQKAPPTPPFSASSASVAAQGGGLRDLPIGELGTCRGCHATTVTEDEAGVICGTCWAEGVPA
jgi:hypothetical protein